MKYDLPITNTVPIKQPPIYTPSKNGEIKAFFINSVRYGRESAEFCQRMNLKPENVTYDRNWEQNRWGFGDYYNARCSIGDFRVMQQNLEDALTSNEEYDIMFIPSVNGFSEFTQKTQEAILSRVKNGTGLILLQPFDGRDLKKSEILKELSPLQALYQEGYDEKCYPDIAYGEMQTSQWKCEEHYITKGIPFELFPCEHLAYYPYNSTGETIIFGENSQPIASVKTVGKGRVVAFGYYKRDLLPQNKNFTGKDDTFNPIIDSWHGVSMPLKYNFMEYFYQLCARATLWCVGKDENSSIENCTIIENSLSISTKGNGDVFVEIKNEFDHVVLPKTKAINNTIQLPQWCSVGGVFRCYITMEENGITQDFYTHFWKNPTCAQISEVQLDKAQSQNGETITANWSVAGKFTKVCVSLIDGYGRVLQDIEISNPQKEQSANFELRHILSSHVYAVVKVYNNEFFVTEGQSQNCVVTPQKRTLDDFEVFMNPQNRGWSDLLVYINELYPEIGMTGNFVGDNKLSAMSGGEGLGIYWYNRAPYVANKEKYLQTHDIEYLKRTPCLNDDSFWQKNEININKNVSINKKYGPVAYFAQDEGSLTCYVDEMDLCFCDFCMSKMRVWLTEIYRDINELNSSWGTNYTSFNEALPMTLLQARKANNFASWADHRTFMELTYANSYKNFSQMIKAVDPQGEIRMSGCQASTAYSGNDYELLHQYVKFFEAYPTGNQYELHRSFRSENTVIGGWFGYGADGYSVRRRIWNAVYHGLTLISIFWEYACLNHDYSFSTSAKDMAVAFKEIRRNGIGKLLLHGAKQDNLGIAIHYSMPSVHGTTAKGTRLKFEQNRQGWIDILEDMGYQYSFVSNRQIENGTLGQYKVLIMPYSIAVSKQEAEEIEKFVKAGGVVIGDIQTAIMDQHCVQYDKGLMDDIFGIKRLTTDCEYFYVCEGFNINKDFKHFNYHLKHTPGKEHMGIGVQFAEIGTRAGTGTAAYIDGFMSNVASCVVNEIGQGKAVYLNFSLHEYPNLRKQENSGKDVRNILRHVLSLSAVKKPAQLLTSQGNLMENGVETFYYAFDNSNIVCVQKELNEKVELNYDGLMINKNANKQLEECPMVLKLLNNAHVYNVRKQEYIGYTNTITDTILEADTNIYSLLSYKPEKIAITCAPQQIAGEEAEIEITLKGEGEINTCVFAINVFSPKGVYNSFYSKNIVAKNAKAKFVIPFAKNDELGQWQIKITDAASGISQIVKIDLN